MAVWTFVRLTLREAWRSRLLVLVAVLTAGYLGLIAWGISKLAAVSALTAYTAGAGLELLAYFVGSSMLALLAVFLPGHSFQHEAGTGLLQAVLTKPIRRLDILAGRWLAAALLLAAWVAIFTAGLVLGVGLQVGYYPPHPVQAAALLLLMALLILSLRMLFGAFLGTLASGIVPLLLFGLGWLGGMVETVGHALTISSMVNAGIITSLVIPTDALWRGASYLLLPQLSPLAGSFVGSDANPAQGMPFIGVDPIAAPMLVWAIAYTLVAFLLGARIFARRDL